MTRPAEGGWQGGAAHDGVIAGKRQASMQVRRQFEVHACKRTPTCRRMQLQQRRQHGIRLPAQLPGCVKQLRGRGRGAWQGWAAAQAEQGVAAEAGQQRTDQWHSAAAGRQRPASKPPCMRPAPSAGACLQVAPHHRLQAAPRKEAALAAARGAGRRLWAPQLCLQGRREQAATCQQQGYLEAPLPLFQHHAAAAGDGKARAWAREPRRRRPAADSLLSWRWRAQ